MQETTYTNRAGEYITYREVFNAPAYGPGLDDTLRAKHDEALHRVRDAGGTIHSINQRKIGRNDPCPCGSGRKFKKCCIRRIASIAPPTTRVE